MASLTNTKISDTYPLLLKIETNGVDGTLRSIEDGDGTASALKISSGAIQVDNIKVDGNAITSTDTNGNIDLTPNGSGEVNISKVDIDSGTIDGVSIGATTISASGNVDFNGDLDVDGTTNLDVVDIDGAVTITTATNYAMTIKSTDADAADIFRIIADDDGALFAFSKDASDDAEMYLYDGSGNANVQISGNNASYFNGGKIGIGDNNPSNFVEIVAADGVGDDIFALRVQNQEATDGRSYGLKVMAGSNSSDTTFELNDHDGSNVLMKVLGDGKVGIKNASPARTLDVVGDIQASSLIKSSVSSNSENLATANGGTLILENTHDTNNNFSNIGGYNHDSLVTSQINFVNVNQGSRHGALTFNTHNGTSLLERVRIDKDGKVGIGQVTLNAMLDIDDGGSNTGIGVPQIRVGSINNVNVYGLIGFGWGGDTTYSPVTIGGLGTDGGGSVEADFVINTRDGTSDAVPVERMRVTHDGKVGIGTTSPESQLTFNTVPYSTSADYGIRVQNPDTTADAVIQHYENSDLVDWWIGSNTYINTSGGTARYNTSKESAAINISAANGHIFFATGGTGANATSRMLINNAGSVCIGRTTALSPIAKLVAASALDGGTTPAASFQANTSTSSGAVVVFHSGDGSECGSVALSNANASDSVTYNASSDYRLKEKVKTLPNGLDRVNQMKPVEFEWKKTKSKSEGFLAHELQEICNYAVTGEKDAMQDVLYQKSDEIPEGKEIGDVKESIVKAQQVDYARITPILVKAIQELSAKVEALENA